MFTWRHMIWLVICASLVTWILYSFKRKRPTLSRVLIHEKQKPARNSAGLYGTNMYIGRNHGTSHAIDFYNHHISSTSLYKYCFLPIFSLHTKTLLEYK